MYTIDGTEVTMTDVSNAVAERRAVIVWSHGSWVNVASLAIYDDAETAEMESERDTRDECYSMGDEVWCELATGPNRAMRAARGLLNSR